MPELPEAETIVRDLRGHITGGVVRSVAVTHRDVLAPELSPRSLAGALRGRRIRALERRGKNVVLRFGTADPESERTPVAGEPPLRLMINLGMTGRLVVGDSPRAGELRHIAVRFRLDHAPDLLYDDVRRFGRLELHDPGQWAERDAELGVEPLSDALTDAHMAELLQRSRSPVRNWLLDQRRVAGVGNIYANEALFRAGVRPDRPANSLSADEAARLRSGVRDVLRDAIEARGTTLNDYRDGSGEEGRFEPSLAVYGRADEPCTRCDTPIERIVMSNRSAFLCPSCQT